MAETFYKYVKGERVKMTSKEVKAFIMKQNKWTSDQYNKQYDILRNKLRAFEAYERASGKDITKQSVRSLLFKEAKAKQTNKGSYKPSIKMQRIRAFTSVSSGKAGQKALQSKVYNERRSGLYQDATYKQFKGLIDTNAMADKIYKEIKNPVMREKALADYADTLHYGIQSVNEKIKQDQQEQEDSEDEENIPFYGEIIGSDEEFDFDLSEYL